GNLLRMRHKHTVAGARYVEGNVLVGLFAARAPVLVPHVHGLPVLDKGREPLTESVHAFTDPQGELLPHVGRPVHVDQVARASAAAPRQPPALEDVVYSPGPL